MGIQVLIVEDEPEFARRFAESVRSDPGLKLIGAVGTVAAARTLLDSSVPDVVLVDLGLPDGEGVEVIGHAVARHPRCDVLVVTMFGDETHVLASIEAGATGYLLKDALHEQIAAAIREVHAGGSPISPGIARRILQRFRGSRAAPASAAAAMPSPLTPRETEILQLVAKGLSFETVGQVCGISPNTVVTHVKHIYRKLAVGSRGEAVYEAGQLGLL